MTSVMHNAFIICGLLFATFLVPGTENATVIPGSDDVPVSDLDVVFMCAPEEVIYGPCYCVSSGNEFRVTCKTNNTAALAKDFVRLQKVFNTTLDYLIHKRGKFDLRPFLRLFNDIVPAEKRKSGGRIIKE